MSTMHTKPNRDTELSKYIRKVKKLRNSINNRIKLFNQLKFIDGTAEAFLGSSFVELCKSVSADGAMASDLDLLSKEARILHLVDNFLREVPYSLVERERAARVKDIDLYTARSLDWTNASVLETNELCNLLSGILSALKVPNKYSQYKNITAWVAGKPKETKADAAVSFGVDANGSPIAV